MAQRGFTLLEMLVVILLIGIAAGLLGLGVRQGLQVAKERRGGGGGVGGRGGPRRGVCPTRAAPGGPGGWG
ncbi:type II secretion system protein, partial [Pseudomonas lactis]|uniref:type II secretion system protein n=1 Tax=Pseudomonas lactis TaxID=1615674 RepID=UPI0039AFBCDA